MLRILVLFLLVVAVCYGLEYNITVDATGGTDVLECRSGEVINQKIDPTVPCKTIAYALAGVREITDQLTLNLRPGTHATSANLVFNFNTYSILGTDTSGPNAIIDCKSVPNMGFQLAVSQPRNYLVSHIAFHNCIGSTGGAINVRQGQGTVRIVNCAFVSNHATINGGAIFSRSSFDVQSSIFSNNSAGSGSGLGGAIYAEGSSCYPSVDRSTFYLNTASSGAAIYALNVGLTETNIMYFIANNFTNNTATSNGGAFFADNAAVGNRTYDFTSSTFDNNCATNAYTDSYEVQVRCTAPCAFSNRGNSSGCTDIARNIPPPAAPSGRNSNRDRAIIIGVVVPFGILAILSVALFFYIRKRHNKEMAKRDDYRKKILRALENMPPEEQEAARLEAENADPSSPKCQLCQTRPINSPLPCGHEVVCSVCRTILLECPAKGCKQPTR